MNNRRSCRTCEYAVEPLQNYARCLKTGQYIKETLHAEKVCDVTFKGYAPRRNWLLRLLRVIFGGLL